MCWNTAYCDPFWIICSLGGGLCSILWADITETKWSFSIKTWSLNVSIWQNFYLFWAIKMSQFWKDSENHLLQPSRQVHAEIPCECTSHGLLCLGRLVMPDGLLASAPWEWCTFILLTYVNLSQSDGHVYQLSESESSFRRFVLTSFPVLKGCVFLPRSQMQSR